MSDLRTAVSELNEHIDRLKGLNGELCEEIKQKDERIAKLEEECETCEFQYKARDYEQANERQARKIKDVCELNRQQRERIAKLEQLVRDAMQMLDRWDRAEWESMPDEHRAYGEYEPEGNLRVLQERVVALGIEV